MLVVKKKQRNDKTNKLDWFHNGSAPRFIQTLWRISAIAEPVTHMRGIVGVCEVVKAPDLNDRQYALIDCRG